MEIFEEPLLAQRLAVCLLPPQILPLTPQAPQLHLRLALVWLLTLGGGGRFREGP